MLTKVRKWLCDYIIIREWVENGEFDGADRIIVIGTKFQAVMIKMLFRGTGKRIFYCEKLKRKYVHGSNAGKIKWIIFDRGLKRKLPRNDCSILFMPKI